MSKLKEVNCPVCMGEEYRIAKNTNIDLHIVKYGDLYSGLKKSQWVICNNCGFVYQNPRPTVKSLEKFYLDSKYHKHGKDQFPDSIEFVKFSYWYYQEKIDYLLRQSGLSAGSVFDIGYGHGGMLRVFADKGFKTYGVEADEEMQKYATKELKLKNLLLGVLNSKIENPKVDVIISNHAFEHFFDLHEVMKGITKILKPGGYILTVIPTYNESRSNLSRLWMNSAHYNMFTHTTLNRLFNRYGLQEVSHTYRGWLKEIDDLWHVAKYTGEINEDNLFKDSPAKVESYLKTWIPLRTLLFSPFYTSDGKWRRIFALWFAVLRSRKEKKLFANIVRFLKGNNR